MNKKESFDIAWEVSNLAGLAAYGDVSLMECGSIIRGLVESSPKVLAQLNDMDLPLEVIELFNVVGIKLDEKQ